MNQEDLQASLEKHNGVGVSAAIYHNGEVIAAAAGLANIATGVEMTTDTVMQIGSITKLLNTTLVMQLVDDGKISLDDPVTKHLPELKIGDPEALSAITVQMLLNHTSGIDGEIVPEHGHDLETIAHAIPRFADMGQIHVPGEHCSYCNTGAVIAGFLCQKLRDRSWYDLVKEKIFAPLGMEHAVALPEDALLHRASVGHFLNRKTGENVRTTFAFLPLSFAPAGSTLMMSAKDLVTFARAHMNGGVGANGTRILSDGSARAMRTKTIEYQGPGPSVGIGLGWMLYGDGTIGHGGGGPGILSSLIAHPEKDFATAVLTNVEHGGLIIRDVIQPYATALDLALAGDALTALARQPAVPVDNPTALVGRFESCATALEVVEHNDGLAMRSKVNFAFYDSSSTEWGPLIPIKFVERNVFVPIGRSGPTPSPFAFVNFLDGIPQHLAGGARLFKRVERQP